MNVTCLACGHTANVADGPAFEDSCLRCDECGARMSFGKLMPRVVVEPYIDERNIRWLRRRFQDPKTMADLFVVDVDAKYAETEAKNILSLVLT